MALPTFREHSQPAIYHNVARSLQHGHGVFEEDLPRDPQLPQHPERGVAHVRHEPAPGFHEPDDARAEHDRRRRGLADGLVSSQRRLFFW